MNKKKRQIAELNEQVQMLIQNNELLVRRMSMIAKNQAALELQVSKLTKGK